jgi:hypothetical protein
MSDLDLPKDNTFAISFDTAAMKKTGIIKCVKVTLSEDTMDAEDRVHINLVDHPLYPQLEQYVKSNLARRRKGR